MARGHHKMATVTRMTGFKPELLRAWENRHHLLTPTRGPGGQRLYTDQDLAILRSVRALLAEGRSIGEIALLGRKHLADLARTIAAATVHPGASGPGADPLPAWPGPARSDGNAHRALQIAARAVGRLSARLEPSQLIELVVDTLADDFQAALARIWVADPGHQVLVLRASAGLSRRTAQSSRARIDLRTYRFKVGVVARTRQAFISNEIVGDPEFDQRWVHKERLASVAILPLVSDDTIYGVMASFFRVALTEEVLGALRMFSAIAAASLAAHADATPRERASA